MGGFARVPRSFGAVVGSTPSLQLRLAEIKSRSGQERNGWYTQCELGGDLECQKLGNESATGSTVRI
ncbi:hypothetical protein ANO14919_116950 [Xylariales sp. No.14919]|nr:hypothetical protein ANO14919_116950 [Xylariales sp. No.14919]